MAQTILAADLPHENPYAHRANNDSSLMRQHSVVVCVYLRESAVKNKKRD